MGGPVDDDIEGLLADRPAQEGRRQTEPSVLRRFVGRPRIWMCVTWCVLGVLWVGLAVIEPATWRFVLGGLYLLLGALQLSVAMSDRRCERGAYERLKSDAR